MHMTDKDKISIYPNETAVKATETSISLWLVPAIGLLAIMFAILLVGYLYNFRLRLRER